MPDVMIQHPGGSIEAKFYESDNQHAPLALILSPHPGHDGTMHNKVVYNVFKNFVRAGFHTIRFNFRGVGNSTGCVIQKDGELNDAMCVLDWFQKKHPGAPYVYLSGFSFGSWIGLQLMMKKPNIKKFIAVSPPANLYDFSFLNPCSIDGYIVQGTCDEIVEHACVTNLVKQLKNQSHASIEYIEIEGADHFFSHHMEVLNEKIANSIPKIGLPKNDTIKL